MNVLTGASLLALAKSIYLSNKKIQRKKKKWSALKLAYMWVASV